MLCSPTPLRRGSALLSRQGSDVVQSAPLLRGSTVVQLPGYRVLHSCPAAAGIDVSALRRRQTCPAPAGVVGDLVPDASASRLGRNCTCTSIRSLRSLPAWTSSRRTATAASYLRREAAAGACGSSGGPPEDKARSSGIPAASCQTAPTARPWRPGRSPRHCGCSSRAGVGW